MWQVGQCADGTEEGTSNAEAKLDHMLNKEKERKNNAYLNFLSKSPKNVYKTFDKKQFHETLSWLCVKTFLIF